jgi:hypothetical protein
MAYKKNFNKKYNRNNYYGGQYNRNNNYMNRPQETKPTFTGFDATKYKRPDITIKDLNGVVYTINGNFSTAFAAELVKTSKEVDKIRKGSDVLEQFPELFDLLRGWCLSLLNLNTDGKTYTMQDVRRGFDDMYVLFNLLTYVTKICNASNQELPRINR